MSIFEEEVAAISDEAELQDMMDTLATKAMDTNRPVHLRDSDTKKRVLVQQRLNELTNPVRDESPQARIQRLRDQGQHDAADSVQFALDGGEGDHPVFKRQQERRDEVSKAAGLREAASMLENSGDAGVQARAKAMHSEADSIEQALHE